MTFAAGPRMKGSSIATMACFRSRSTQQGYSPFSTWTRGLAWAMLGYAEELEFLATIDDASFASSVGLNKADVVRTFEQAAVATCDHYIERCAARDGIVYWDEGAPGLAKLGDWRCAGCGTVQ